jgi:hypothetical protein
VYAIALSERRRRERLGIDRVINRGDRDVRQDRAHVGRDRTRDRHNRRGLRRPRRQCDGVPHDRPRCQEILHVPEDLRAAGLQPRGEQVRLDPVAVKDLRRERGDGVVNTADHLSQRGDGADDSAGMSGATLSAEQRLLARRADGLGEGNLFDVNRAGVARRLPERPAAASDQAEARFAFRHGADQVQDRAFGPADFADRAQHHHAEWLAHDAFGPARRRYVSPMVLACSVQV